MIRGGRAEVPALLSFVTGIEEDPDEIHAIASVKAGDTGSYGYLMSKYSKRVLSIAWGIARNSHDAEDLAQEAFVRAYQSIGRFESGQPFGPWLFRIVTNLSLDLMKHRSRVRHEELGEDRRGPRRDEADVPAISGEIGRRIDEAIESLPGMQRIAARLHFIDQFEQSEIAAMMSLSEGTVRSHLSLARKKLRDRLADVYGASDD